MVCSSNVVSVWCSSNVVVVAGDVAAGGAAGGLAGGDLGPVAVQPAQRAGGGHLPSSGQLTHCTVN